MSSTQRPIQVTSLHGRVIQGPYGKRSKSEREAIFIETPEAQRYLLRRKTGPMFGDAEPTRYIGHQIKCDGFVVGTTLIAEQIELVK
jgi:hypothetical protein